MKKFITSKRFVVSSLCVACLGILAACWFVNRPPGNEFQPEETSAIAQEWEETVPTTSVSVEKPSSAYIPKETESAEEYPKVAEVIETESSGETTKEVVVDFTPAEKPQEPPPPAPEGKTIIEDPGPEHPVNLAPEVTEPPAETPTNTEPVPGSNNNNGAVYDPAFGWVVPGEVQQSTIDSDGDPNKMVGNMGD